MNRLCGSVVHAARCKILWTSCSVTQGNGTTPVIRSLFWSTFRKPDYVIRRSLTFRGSQRLEKHDMDGIPKHFTMIYKNSSTMYFVWMPVATLIGIFSLSSLFLKNLWRPRNALTQSVLYDNYYKLVFVMATGAVVSVGLIAVVRRSFLRIYKDRQRDDYIAIRPHVISSMKRLHFNQKDICVERGVITIYKRNYGVNAKDFLTPQLYNQFMGYGGKNSNFDKYLQQLKSEIGENKRQK